MTIRAFVYFLVLSLNFGYAVSARHLPGMTHSGDVKINIQNLVNGEPLVLNAKKYVNENGDSFTVRIYKYYISNIVLVTQDGKEYAEMNSYHLINEAKPGTKEVIIKDVPAGMYSAIKFMIGVDSLHNVSGAQSGDLDPIKAMFWDWNTGYIMAKLEGNTPGENGKELTFHIGGFAGAKSVLKNVTIPLPGKLQVTNGNVPAIHLNADIAQWFKSPVTIDFAKTNTITIEGPEATALADNYADMFTLDHIEP